MLPFKKILCPTDFSEPSYEAPRVAGEMAGRFSSGLIVLHVVSPLPMIRVATGASAAGFNVAAYQNEMAEASEGILEEITAQKIPRVSGITHVMLNGDPPHQIVRFAEAEGVDLVVIATHGQTGWRRLVFESVTEKVVRQASCAVLTIHEPRRNSGK